MNPLRYRAANTLDIPAIVELVTSAYRGDSSRQGWTTEADLLEGQRIDRDILAEDISRPHSVVILAETSALDAEATDGVMTDAPTAGPSASGAEGGATDAASARLIGCAHIARTDDGVGYFGMFAVRPGTQGGGAGKQILAEAERQAVELWGVDTMEMTVIEPRTELIAYYERRGYTRTGELRDFPYGDERFGIPLRDDLRMVVLSKPLP